MKPVTRRSARTALGDVSNKMPLTDASNKQQNQQGIVRKRVANSKKEEHVQKKQKSVKQKVPDKPKEKVEKVEKVVAVLEELPPKVIELKKEIVKETVRVKKAWDILDEEDTDDPVMVAEYANDIFAYMKSVECSTLPSLNYMASQTHLNWGMRGILVDWLIEVHAKFHMTPETLFLTINLLDRYLSKRQVTVQKFQLIGLTCLFVAAKYEEVLTPCVSNVAFVSDGAFDEADILSAERSVLRAIDFNLSFCSPLNFLRRISKPDDYCVECRTMAKYLMEVGLVESEMVGVCSSLLAASAMYLARRIMGRGEWSELFVHYSGYEEEKVVEVVGKLCSHFAGTGQFEALETKYSGNRMFCTAEIVRAWMKKNLAAIYGEEESEGEEEERSSDVEF